MILFLSCSSNQNIPIKKNIEFNTISFEVVEKKIIIKSELPLNTNRLINEWFEKNVKVNGFEGLLIFQIDSYKEALIDIPNGKRVDISMTFSVVINKPALSQKHFIEGNVDVFGEISGNFSLDDLDNMILNTQFDLIYLLSQDLQSKIS